MHTLREKLSQTSDFLFGVEMVSIRGSMTEKKAVRARTFANDLVDCPAIDWVSITDNAGGNPQLAPHALGKPLLYGGKEVIIHMTCKDLNRNGLESEAWLLNSEGFHNILALTGDYPVTGSGGMAKPVFDIDSVGLISMLNKMNQGFDVTRSGDHTKSHRLEKTQFLVGAVTCNFKLFEGEVIPQYLKLQKKVECGAQFIINQVGFDSRKIHELYLYIDNHGMKHIPLIGNVYLLNPKVAKIFHENRIPGIVVSPSLLELCERHGQSADSGKAFFYEFAAKQAAIYRGLGYRGAYLGGVHNLGAIEEIMRIERTFSVDDWRQFAKEIRFSRPGEFFYYGEDSLTGLADSSTQPPTTRGKKSKHVGLMYYISDWIHKTMFTANHKLAEWGANLCRKAGDPNQGPGIMRAVEKLSKGILYHCKDCGDCSLPDIAYLCPESQCAKNQRNGPCGGTREGRCEVDGFGDCIWLRAYERLKYDGKVEQLLDHAPMVQNQALRGTSAWANNWLRRDHAGRENSLIHSKTPIDDQVEQTKSPKQLEDEQLVLKDSSGSKRSPSNYRKTPLT
jgi:methylenetetrahydrofolate reductase (NADPH)